MVLNVICAVYVLVVAVSSIWMGTTINEALKVVSVCLLLLSLFGEKRLPRLRYLQIVFVALFHWNSQLNWCLPIYMTLAFKECYRIHDLKKSVPITFLFACVYSVIRISYVPSTLYNILVTFFDIVNFIVVVLVGYYIVKVEREKQSLSLEKKRLSTRDPLTGLLNYQEYHKQLAKLLKKKDRRFALFLIDCIDLKSMNSEQGYQGGNRILIKVADYLRHTFTGAHIIAHYGGDEFAVAVNVDNEESTIETFLESLDVRLPKQLNIEVTYGYAVYPADGGTKDELISAAEQKLFAMKRETWLKREEQVLRAEKLRLVGELAAGIAHEIRNPLTTVRGFLQLSKQNEFNIKPWYELMMQETTRVNELTAEFLQFSKKHATQFRVQPLQECVRRVVQLLESEATYLGHQIHCETADTPALALIDKDKMVQLLINLVRNAFDAMEREGIVIIRLHCDEDTGVIEVQDTGVGIPASQLDEIFNPFFTTKETGTGLGLSICHQIMQVHSGTIDVESEVEEGTTFRVRLPLVQEHDQDTVVSLAPHAQSSFGKANV